MLKAVNNLWISELGVPGFVLLHTTIWILKTRLANLLMVLEPLLPMYTVIYRDRDINWYFFFLNEFLNINKTEDCLGLLDHAINGIGNSAHVSLVKTSNVYAPIPGKIDVSFNKRVNLVLRKPS